VISLDALYINLRGQGMDLRYYREFMRFNWYRSLSGSGAVRKHTVCQTTHYIAANPAEFLSWAETCGFWSDDEVNQLAGLVLVDLMKAE